jgi:hypothetical protein
MALSMIRVEICDERRGSELAQVGELFHQLLHSVPSEEHGEFGVFSIAFALKHGSLTIF